MTKIDPNTVRIEPWPDEEKCTRGYSVFRGRKLVMIGEERYGSIHMQQHGGNGNSYTFRQIGGEEIGDAGKSGRHFHPVTVYGDRMERRGHRSGDVPLKPIAERLHAKAVELIETGKLISGAAQAERVAESNRKFAEARDRAATKELEKLQHKARAALRMLTAYIGTPPGQEPPADDVAMIVAAMKWAQTQ